MKIQFKVMIDGSGTTVARAYQDMRRKLLAMNGWADTDEAICTTSEGTYDWVPEEEVQAARKAFPHSKDGMRVCNGGTKCNHDLIVFGIPACMMDKGETRKMVKRGRKIQQTGEIC